MPRRRAAVLRLRTEVTYEDLKRIESTEQKRTDTPRALPRSAIKVADKVFQWRPHDEDMQGSEDHVRVLVRAIGTGKERHARGRIVNWKTDSPKRILGHVRIRSSSL
jgi:hypothetical protein